MLAQVSLQSSQLNSSMASSSRAAGTSLEAFRHCPSWCFSRRTAGAPSSRCFAVAAGPTGGRDHSRFRAEDLRVFVASTFRHLGLPVDDAGLVARCLVHADLWAQSGHGVQRVPMYAGRLRAGVVKPRPDIQIKQTAPSSCLVHGDDGMGFVVATRAMDEAIRIAKTQGVGLAGVHRSTHFGCSAHYVRQALEADMISLVFTNSSPAMPPFGGAKALLGASPFAAGAPSGQSHPLVLDMSTTVIARGKLRLMAQRGEPIPPDVGLDEHGRPTRDGMEAFHGVTLPFGGAKGAAISLLMDILSGLLTGAGFGGKVRSLYNDTDAPQDVGHFMMCIRPDLFLPSMDVFKARMDELVSILKSQPCAEGFDEVLVPGEPESRAEVDRLARGIPLQDDVVESLRTEAKLTGLDFPDPVS
eukprot:TRINITY_DN45424_c0_g1_i1.p1 TRINITY_DN45424_c0_g1~~TRINITY_DN45424_c0_g1_i1.p1  ORF type:complete len:414 (-),score=65.80 TRINITY_DN45424_c0_g1_i1:95-1336(-)